MDVVVLGEVLIDFISTSTETFKKCFGGAPGNVAIGASRQGCPTGFIGKVGKDEFGKFLIETLSTNRVDTRYVTATNRAVTSMSFVSISEDGESDFVFVRNPGADMLLGEENIPEDYIKQAKLIHFGSISMTHTKNYYATRRAIEIAKNNNLLVSFDPNIRLNLWKSEQSCKSRIMEGIAWADIIKLSEEELALLTDESSIEAGVQRLSLPEHKLLIVTAGSKFCYYSMGRRAGYVRSFPVRCVDSTGCGDAFVSTVLTEVSKVLALKFQLADLCEEQLNRIVTRASAAGALVATKTGAIEGLPTTEEIQQFLTNQDNHKERHLDELTYRTT